MQSSGVRTHCVNCNCAVLPYPAERKREREGGREGGRERGRGREGGREEEEGEGRRIVNGKLYVVSCVHIIMSSCSTHTVYSTHLDIGGIFLQALGVLAPVILILSEHFVHLVLRLINTTHVHLTE